MDILVFLKDGTTFIRDFYNTASSPFRETMRKIEAGEAPFEPHLAKYEDEPLFTTEWIDANTSLEVLGRVCASMLSAALKLYFNTWRAHLRIELQPSKKMLFNKHGFLNGYKHVFAERVTGRASGTSGSVPSRSAGMEAAGRMAPLPSRGRAEHASTNARKSG